MQDEANQAGVGEERGLEGGRETTQNYIEMDGVFLQTSPIHLSKARQHVSEFTD